MDGIPRVSPSSEIFFPASAASTLEIHSTEIGKTFHARVSPIFFLGIILASSTFQSERYNEIFIKTQISWL